MKRPEIVLIAAVARNGAIGRDNALLWHEPADQRHFRQATMGCPVIMGRRTWDSLPPRFRPLPGRRNLVVSRNPAFTCPGAEVAGSLTEALERAGGGGLSAAPASGAAATGHASDDAATAAPAAPAAVGEAARVFVIGGGQLYADALPLADTLMLTEIDADLPGDTFFPAWDRSAFAACDIQPGAGADGTGYRFVSYRRV
jgi:dihydrofolate reductase